MSNSTAAPPVLYLHMQWESGTVVVSYVISTLAAYSTLQSLQLRLGWVMIAASAFVFGIAGIFCMHFVGMEAMFMGVAVKFDVGLTVLSGFCAWIPLCIAFALVQRSVNATINKVSEKNSAMHVTDVSLEAHIEAAKGAPHGMIVACGVLVAFGMCLMHYIGQVAMRSVAVAEPRPGVIAASVIIALAAAIAALYLAFVVPLARMFPAVTALVCGVAVCAMHYTGMYGFRYLVDDPDNNAAYQAAVQVGFSPTTGTYLVCLSTTLSLCLLAFTTAQRQAMTLRVAAQFERYIPSVVVRSILICDQWGTYAFDDAPAAFEASLSRSQGAGSVKSGASSGLANVNYAAAQMMQRELTVMFCDLKDFTRASENMDIDELLKNLSTYNETASGFIQESVRAARWTSTLATPSSSTGTACGASSGTRTPPCGAQCAASTTSTGTSIVASASRAGWRPSGTSAARRS